MPSPMHDDTVELGGPVGALDAETIDALAKQYLLREFASEWEIESPKLTEWLAEQNADFARVTDEDEVDQILDDFIHKLDWYVRVAIGDFRSNEELAGLDVTYRADPEVTP